VALGLGDARGVPVTATLQHPDHADVHAVGDCARFLPQPLPRIGVHGVRQGPVLLASLLARARGAELPSYEPQREALAVLDLGDGVGLAVRGRWWWQGRAALLLKRWIDRRWLRQYRVLHP
jgi:NADH dehydrogenase FAD-containing subunit